MLPGGIVSLEAGGGGGEEGRGGERRGENLVLRFVLVRWGAIVAMGKGKLMKLWVGCCWARG